MIPVIQQLLHAESEARKIVTESREAVQHEQGELDQDEQLRLQEARQAADGRYQQAIAESRQEAEKLRKAAAAELAAESETFRIARKGDIERAVQLVVAELSRSDLDTE